MSILKCKICGGDIEITANENIGTCQYCGTTITLPRLDSDKKSRLFNRAHQYRLNCEFDQAFDAYQAITLEDETEAEAYWGMLLSEYGVEYVEDPKTGKRIPTCHRTNYNSVLNSTNYQLACQYAEAEIKFMYQDEAKVLDGIQKKIISISSKEEPYDVFICYKETDEAGERTEDSVLAQDIYDALTDKGMKVFFARITLEDKLGQDYEPYIYAALRSAKVMLMVTTSSEHSNAIWVKNEWSRFIGMMSEDSEKVLIPVYKDISPYELPSDFVKYQSQDMGKVGALQDLIRGVKRITEKPVKSSSDEVINVLLEENEQRHKKEKRTKRFIGIVIALVAISILPLFFRWCYGEYKKNLPIETMTVEINKKNFNDYFEFENVEKANKYGVTHERIIMFSKLYDEGWIYLPQESDFAGHVIFESEQYFSTGNKRRGIYVGTNSLNEIIDDKGFSHVTIGTFENKGTATFVRADCVSEYSIDEEGRKIVLINGVEYYDKHYESDDVSWCGRPY